MPSGSILQLVALGLDTVYLTGDPQITLFKMVYRRHTNFTIVPQTEIIQEVKKLDLETNYTLLKRGDCISNLNLVFEIGNFIVKYQDPTNANVVSMLAKYFIYWKNLYQPTQIISTTLYNNGKNGTGNIYDQVYNYVQQNNFFLRFINDVNYGLQSYKIYKNLPPVNQRLINRIYNDTSFDISRNLIYSQLDIITNFFNQSVYVELYEYLNSNIIQGNINGIYPSDILTNLLEITSYLNTNGNSIQFVNNFIRFIYDYGYGIFYLNSDYTYHVDSAYNVDGSNNRVLKFFELDSSGNYILDSSGNRIPKQSNLSVNTILSSRLFDIIKSYQLDVDISGVNLVSPFLIRDVMYDQYLYSIVDLSNNILDVSNNQNLRDTFALYVLLNEINPSSSTTFLAKKIDDYYTYILNFYYSNQNYENLNLQNNYYNTYDTYIILYKYLSTLTSNEIIDDTTLIKNKPFIINSIQQNIQVNFKIFYQLMIVLRQAYFDNFRHFRLSLYKTFTNYVNITPIDYNNVQSDFQILNILLPNTLNINDNFLDNILYVGNDIFFRKDLVSYLSTSTTIINSGYQNTLISDYLNVYSLWSPYTIDNQKSLLQQIAIPYPAGPNLYTVLTSILNQNAQKSVVIMNYLPLFLINEIPNAINTNLKAINPGLAPLSLTTLDLSNNSTTFKKNLYTKIVTNVILSDTTNKNVQEYDLINAFANKYITSTNNFAIYFLIRPEKSFQLTVDGKIYFIPNIRGVIETFRQQYFSLIQSLPDSSAAKVYAFEIINFVLDSFMRFDFDSVFDTNNLNTSTYNIYQLQYYKYDTSFRSNVNSFVLTDNRTTRYMYAQSSVYNYLHSKSTYFINGFYNNIALNPSYYETDIGLSMNDLLNIFYEELISKISTFTPNYFTGGTVSSFDQSGNLYPRIDVSYNLTLIGGTGTIDSYVYNQTGNNVTIPVQTIGYDFNDFQNAYNKTDFEHLIDGSGVDIVGMLNYTNLYLAIIQYYLIRYSSYKELLQINNLYQFDISYNTVSDVVDYYNTAITSTDPVILSIISTVKGLITSTYAFYGDCIYAQNYLNPLVNWSVQDLIAAMNESANPFIRSVTPNLYDCYVYHHAEGLDIQDYFDLINFTEEIFKSAHVDDLYNNFQLKSDVFRFVQDFLISKSDGAYLLNYTTQSLSELINYIQSYLQGNKTKYYNIVTNIIYNNNLPIPENAEIEYENQNNLYYYPILEYSQTRITYENSVCDKIITSMIANLPAEYSWVSEPGHYLFEKLQLLINGDTFDFYNSYLLSLKTKLFTASSKMSGYNKLIGNITTLTTFNNANKSNVQFILPLDFYFTREITNSLPMLNILYSDITINFKTRPLQELLVISDGAFIEKQPKILCKLIVDYVYLEMEERMRIAASKLEFLADHYNNGRKFTYKYSNLINGKIREKLYFSDPTKFILWRVKAINNDPQNWNINDYYNITKPTYTYQTANYPPYTVYRLVVDQLRIIKTISFYFNGNKRQSGDYGYFNAVIPYECNLGSLNAGEFLYSFSLLPKLLQPSGTANFTKIDDIEIEHELNPTFIQVMKDNDLEIEIEYFSFSYQILRIMSGFAAPAFINTK